MQLSGRNISLVQMARCKHHHTLVQLVAPVGTELRRTDEQLLVPPHLYYDFVYMKRKSVLRLRESVL